MAFQTKLNEAIQQKAKCELGEDEDRREQVIQIIRQWLIQQPHLHQIRLGDVIPLREIICCTCHLETH